MAPSAPGNVTVSRTGWTNANLVWTDASTNELTFQAQISTDGGNSWANLGAAIARNGTQSGQTGQVLTQTVAVNATTNAMYRVQATNATGSTASTSVILNNTVAPTEPGNVAVTCTDAEPAACTVTWVNQSNNTAYFYVERASDAGFTVDRVRSTFLGNAVSATFTGLTRAKSWYFRVQGFNDSVLPRVYTNKVIASPAPVPPL